MRSVVALALGLILSAPTCDSVLGGGDGVLPEPAEPVLIAVDRVAEETADPDEVTGYSRFYARSSGSSRLSTTATINSISVTPDFAYSGEDAATTWTATTAGNTLTLGGTGTAPTTGVRAPFSDGTRAITGAVATGANAQSYRSTTAYGDTDAKDLLIEVVVRRCNPGANGVFATTATSGMGSEGVSILQESGTTTVSIHDGTSEVFDRTDTTAVSSHGPWQIYHLFVDHGDTTGAQLYAAGTIRSTSVNASAWGSIDGSTLTIGGAPDSDTEGLDNECGIAWIAQWSRSSWFAGGATNTTDWAAFARRRTVEVMGIRFADQSTDYAPSTIDRALAVGCPVYDSTAGTTQLFNLGEDLPCNSNAWGTTSWGKGTGTRTPRYCGHQNMTNLVADIATTLASWTNVNSTDAEDALAGPFGTTTMGTITGDGADDVHGLSTSETLTAARYTFSIFARAGTQSFAYLDVSSIANVSAYFDLTTCTEGTTGTAAVAETEDYGGGLCRLSITYTGTVAAHTHRVACAISDGDNTSDVATACLGVDMAQVELADAVTPFHEATTARSSTNLRYSPTGVHPTAAGSFRMTMMQPKRSNANTSDFVWTVSDGSANNRYETNFAANNYGTSQDMRTGGVSSGGSPAAAGPTMAALLTPGETRYIAGTWSSDFHSVHTDDAVGYQVSAVAPPSTITRVEPGGRFTTNSPRGCISNVDIYDTQDKRSLAAWGDSNTATTAWAGAAEAWPGVLGWSVRDQFRGAVNGGTSGETCDQIAVRQTCADSPYGFVAIMCGTNDIGAAASDDAEVIADIEGMIAQADGCGQTVVLMTILPNDGWDSTQLGYRAALNTWIRAQEGVTVAHVVDVACATGTGSDCETWDPLYDYDGGHMNAAGHALVAGLVETELGW